MTSPLDAPDASRSHEATASIEADLPTIYARRFSDADAPRRGGVWRELTRFLQRYIPESAVVLDLACDRGAFINEVRAGERWAVDLRDVREHLAPGVNFVQSSGLALGEVLDAETFDVVFISNYLEHLGSADEVVEQLRVIRRLLKPGGRVVILQPNIRLVGGSYWDFLDHKTPLTEKSVVEAAQTAGLETVELIIRFLPYTTKSRFPQIPSWFGRTSPSVPRGCCSVARRCTSGVDLRNAFHRQPKRETHEDPDHRRRRVHQRLSRARAARGRPRGHRPRRLLEVRPAHQVVRRPPALSVRRRRCQGRRAHDRARLGRRPGRRRGGDDRWDQLLPRVRVRPAGRERADPGVDVRRRDRVAQGRPAEADHRRELVDGLRVGDDLPDAGGRREDLAAADLDVRLPEARLGVLRRRRMGAVPAARTRSSGRSTASGSASAGPPGTRTSCRAT